MTSMLHKLLVSSISLVPRPMMRRIAGRYIAGETQEEALVKLRELAREGYPGILDILGEDSSSEAHARAATTAYIEGATAIAEAGLDTYVSIKPTHLGLRTSETLALELYRELTAHCARLGVRVRVEMEDHPNTDATLRLFETLRAEFDNVGIVLQARLLRTPDDIAKLAPGPLDLRMVKGIYLEPASIAHTERDPIRDAYLAACRQLLERGDVRVRFATHDDQLGEQLAALVKEFAVPRENYEFQVLLGVQNPLWKRWKSAGHTVRVYVPFGPEWREYSQRRLRKNPDLLKAVMRDLMPL
jgi:proline dehydrogenase